MVLAKLMSLVFSFSAAQSDSALEHVRSEQTRLADSAWTDRRFYLEVSLDQGASFGDLKDQEQKFSDDIGFVVASNASKSDPVPAKIGITSTNLGIGLWTQYAERADLGMAYRFHLEVASTQYSGKSEIVLTGHEALLRGRFWLVRRANFQIGPQLGWGWAWGVLNRYPLEQGVPAVENSLSSSEIKIIESYMKNANKDLSINGSVCEFGGVMSVRIVPAFTVGGGLVVSRRGLDLASSDPMKNYGRSYPSSLTNWDVGLQLHASVRFGSREL